MDDDEWNLFWCWFDDDDDLLFPKNIKENFPLLFLLEVVVDLYFVWNIFDQLSPKKLKIKSEEPYLFIWPKT